MLHDMVQTPDSATIQATPETPWNALLAKRDDAYLLALRLTARSADAEDVVQESYLRALKAGRELPRGDEGWFWFQRVIINTARDCRTAQNRRIARERGAALNANVSADAPGAQHQNELKDAIATAMNGLDEHARTILCLHYEQDLPYAKAAELLGENEGSLRATASRGIQALREKLERNGYSTTPMVITGTLAAGLGIKAPVALTSALFALPATFTKTAVVAGKASLTLGSKIMLTTGLVAAAVFAVNTFPRIGIKTPAASQPQAAPTVQTAGDAAVGGQNVSKKDVVTISPSLAAILNTKVDVCFRRDLLQEVLQELSAQTGLKWACPTPLDRSFTFSLEQQQIRVEDVLKGIAKVGGLQLEFHGDYAVYWKRADSLDLFLLGTKSVSADAATRRAVVHEVARLSDPRVYPLLFRLAADTDPVISVESLAVLSNLHYRSLRFGADVKGLVPVLLARLNAASAASNRPLLNTLGATGDERAAEPMIKLLSDADPQVRANVAYGMAFLPPDKTRQALLALFKDKEAYVRATACASVAFSKDSETVEAIKALTLDSDPMVSSTAATNLVSMHPDQVTLDWLASLLKSDLENVRTTALSAFAQFRAPQVLPELLKLLHDPDPNTQSLAAYCLGHSRDQRAVAPLLDLLNSPDVSVGMQAASALGELRDDSAFEPLKALLKNSEPEVRANAALAISLYRAPGALDLIAPLQSDPSPLVRSRMAEALLQVFDGYSTAILMKLAKDADQNVRASVAKQMGRSGDASFVAPLCTLAKDEDANVRLWAVVSLGSYSDPTAVTATIAALDDTDSEVRRVAGLFMLQAHTYFPDVDSIVKKAQARHPKAETKPVPRQDEF
jgi:RNA polymerase sigma factor (sigma-70 family)